MAHIFITGGTGFIGMQVLQQLSRANHTITALVRSKVRWEQVCKQMAFTNEGLQSITPVIGDLSAPSFGLSSADSALVRQADVVIHAGGPMDILLGEEEARIVFLQAADEMLALADRIHADKGLKHFIHLVGFKSPFNDQNMNAPESVIARLEQEPPYERMKCLADLRIRQGAQQAGYPLSVVHPSVVIGNSENGDTPQTGGLGILVRSTARKMMGLVPGGASHWLPLVHVDHAAAFMVALVQEPHPANGTYYLMDDTKDSPSMLELVTGMAKELRVSKPLGSISLGLLSKSLGGPLGRKLGIPKESLDFIIPKDTEYPLKQARDMQLKYGLTHSVNASILPSAFADLDFRLIHSHAHRQAEGYKRGKRGPLATLEKSGQQAGETRDSPLIFVHGTLSGADWLVPLAEQFPTSTVCLVDLPGFGRSPYHHVDDVLEGHVQSLVQAIQTFDTPVTLVGHSLGGLLAAQVFQRVPEQIRRLHMLQPVLQRAPRKYRSARMTAAALRRLRAPGLQKQLLAQSCFQDISDIPPTYVTYVLEELKSPRVRRTTAGTLSALARAESFYFSQGDYLRNDKVSILWGTQDRIYQLPEQARSVNTLELSAAHHFPLSQPAMTAQLLRQQEL
ncbi:alpha/beta fold hydrolase [Paenibacillus sp. SYP-B3998]|uniref:Alpha/beta fold hydrolase n=1 Tax=Paenibacillus sp. SYP-B3998 TaxID=2678564 RepID=A0A6G4A0H1_9BACL|nr:alpha/beta fold hydrolase [Paenibacillus sp. SYP-B3998]NEW07963.1 alpha/beta fold hydrolase [Paenibacillus sp. SYP-B3998]